VLKLDHITVIAPTLAEGVAHVRACLDIEVPFGTRHTYMGTHNHRLQLGNRVYLEIVALDPDRRTAVVQPGSLPLYGAVVLSTVLLLPGVAVLRNLALPEGLVVAESGLQVAITAIVVGAAIGAARVRRRLSAVLLLGAVGYGMAVLFVVQGAPDLALTQLLVETLSLAMFVLVLRRLPERFEEHLLLAGPRGVPAHCLRTSACSHARA